MVSYRDEDCSTFFIRPPVSRNVVDISNFNDLTTTKFGQIVSELNLNFRKLQVARAGNRAGLLG